MPRCLSKKAFTPLENYSSIKGKSLTGFTLIELIIVLSLLAILASVAVAKFTDISKKAIVTQEIATISNLRTAVLLFRAANGYWPSEQGKSPAIDLFSLLENPPPYKWGSFPPTPDGKTWVLTYDNHTPFNCQNFPSIDITCPHFDWGASKGSWWIYSRRDSDCYRAGEIILQTDWSH